MKNFDFPKVRKASPSDIMNTGIKLLRVLTFIWTADDDCLKIQVTFGVNWWPVT